MPKKKKYPAKKRSIHYHLCVDEEECKLIQERMIASGIVSLSAYMRKMCIDGYCVTLDLSVVKELVSLLRSCTNNLNQLAKIADETDSIYVSDIADLRCQHDALWDAANTIMRQLAKLK